MHLVSNCCRFRPDHLLQEGARLQPQRVVRQEQQQGGAFSELLLQQVRLCSRRLQPPQDALMVLKHPAANGLRGEVTLMFGENLKKKKKCNQHKEYKLKLNTENKIFYQRGVKSSVKVNAFILCE